MVAKFSQQIIFNFPINFQAEYYDNGHCHTCHSTCETCKGPTEADCLTCSSSLLLQNNKCVNTCDDGYYMEAGICAKCLHTCNQCVSRMNCTSCSKGLQLQSGECRTTCAEGFVYIFSNVIICLANLLILCVDLAHRNALI